MRISDWSSDVCSSDLELGISRFVAFGTSLGGLITMHLAATRPKRLAGVLLNDIGPAIEEAGLQRIRAYVGTGGSYPTWVHAARALAENNAPKIGRASGRERGSQYG